MNLKSQGKFKALEYFLLYLFFNHKYNKFLNNKKMIINDLKVNIYNQMKSNKKK